MRYYTLFVVLTFALFAVAAVLGAVVSRCTWARVRSSVRHHPPRFRTGVLFALRMLPAVAGASVALLFAAGFVRHEPRQTIEVPGILLFIGALAGVWLLSRAMLRAMTIAATGTWFVRLTRHCRRSALPCGTPVWIVDTRYPIAAVIGVFRPRLLLSSRILSECSQAEIDAIVAHEHAHMRHGDNLIRAAMILMPDPLGRFGAATEVERAWSLAAEEAADGEAAGDSEEKRTALAHALVRVAQMADGKPPDWTPALAFYRGQDLQHRVERLLAAPSDTLRSIRVLPLVTAAVVGLVLAGITFGSRAIHGGQEWIVRTLP